MLIDVVRMLVEERGEPMPAHVDDDTLRQTFQALCNIRPPNLPKAGFFELQDAFLKAEKEARGVVDVNEFEFNNGIALWQGDITRLNSDAIVNAANSALLGCFQPLHACIDNVIHTNAGIQLRLACHEHMRGGNLPTGQVVATPAFNLPSRYVFHTVGPIVKNHTPTERDEALLAKCYENCLNKAAVLGLDTIAFCSVSTGLFGYPQDKACPLVVRTVRAWLKKVGGVRVIFDVFSDDDKAHYEQALGQR